MRRLHPAPHERNLKQTGRTLAPVVDSGRGDDIMLSRGFYDAVPIWPVLVWPVFFSSVFYGFLRLCQINRQRYQFSIPSGHSWRDVPVRWFFLPAASLFEVTVHAYMLWLIGPFYLFISLPIYVFGWMVLPALLDNVVSAVLVLPAVYILFGAAFVVLLGFADISTLRALNSAIYSLLSGAPVTI